ncbi:hypothetical protein BD414DRAFT_496964 [Trametes punicea]|nr:hypothetical protein BD414DRAFT_496964 [Trametes punicea]
MGPCPFLPRHSPSRLGTGADIEAHRAPRCRSDRLQSNTPWVVASLRSAADNAPGSVALRPSLSAYPTGNSHPLSTQRARPPAAAAAAVARSRWLRKPLRAAPFRPAWALHGRCARLSWQSVSESGRLHPTPSPSRRIASRERAVLISPRTPLRWRGEDTKAVQDLSRCCQRQSDQKPLVHSRQVPPESVPDRVIGGELVRLTRSGAVVHQW